MSHFRKFVLAFTLLLTVGSASTAYAQVGAEGPVDVKHRNDCRLAAQVIATGTVEPKSDWALSMISSCGAEGGRALAAAVRQSSSSSDTTWLNRLTQRALYLHDGQLYRAALEVAGATHASVPARIFAFRTLVNHVEPTTWFHAIDDMAPERFQGIWHCSPSFLGHEIASTGLAIPEDGRREVRELASRTFATPTAPESVKAAAHCAMLTVQES